MSSPDAQPSQATPFLEWDENQPATKEEHRFNVGLAEKAAKFLKLLTQYNSTTDYSLFFIGLAPTATNPYHRFMDSLLVLMMSSYTQISHASSHVLEFSFNSFHSSERLKIVEAGTISRALNAVRPHSLPIVNHEGIHSTILNLIIRSLSLGSSYELLKLAPDDDAAQHAIRETLFHQVIAPSSQYFHHLCENRNLMTNRRLVLIFYDLLTLLLRVCAYHSLSIQYILRSPLPMATTSVVVETELDQAIWRFFAGMFDCMEEWAFRPVPEGDCKLLNGLLSEGLEDEAEFHLFHEANSRFGATTVNYAKKFVSFFGFNH
ncbi:hypothetical protein BLNAU_15215 [Blattamonas nauphoetae]|uniref:Uncharacterized protein n=1 Tax=Blattamonas nauphoetae TaxID=2049346 RepID=A0ABQ9XEJ9_9EUKA|nr:hypothetical protein BLNAU_15215 [Blattamonas nauphoetae]